MMLKYSTDTAGLLEHVMNIAVTSILYVKSKVLNKIQYYMLLILKYTYFYRLTGNSYPHLSYTSRMEFFDF